MARTIHKYLIFIILCFATEAVAQYNPAPDSIVKFNSLGQAVRRSCFKYDASMRQTNVEHYTWNKKNGEWSGTLKENVKYDNDGNVCYRMTSYWNQEEHEWMDVSEEKTAYDAAGRIISEEVLDLNRQRKVWMGSRKNKSVYNAGGQRTYYEVYRWDDSKDVWEPDEAIESTFDVSTRLRSADVRKEWDGSEWVNDNRRSYEYDAQTRSLSSITVEYWNNDAWEKHNKTAYVTTDAGENGEKLVRTQNLRYDTQLRQWVNTEMTTSRIDSLGTELSIKREQWNGLNWEVLKMERTEVEYDENGEKIHESRYRWNGGDEWIGISMSEKVYNDYGDVLCEVRMEWDVNTNTWKGVTNNCLEYNDMGDLLLEQRFKWDKTTRSWFKQSRANFQYDEEHNKINETTTSWNPQKNRWEEFYKGRFEYQLDKMGFIHRASEYIWKDDDWVLVQSTLYY